MSTITETITLTNDSFYGHFEIKPTDFKIDYNHFFTPVAKSRVHNYLRVMGKWWIISDKFIICNFLNIFYSSAGDKVFSVQGRAYKFSNGNPNPKCFPYEELSVKLRNGNLFQLKGEVLSKSLSYLNCNGYCIHFN